MNIQTFKEKTSGLDPKTRVMVSCFTLEYITAHPEAANAYELYPDGSLNYRDSNDKESAPTLEEFYQLPNDTTIMIDVEDGFSYQRVEQVLVLSSTVILL